LSAVSSAEGAHSTEVVSLCEKTGTRT